MRGSWLKIPVLLAVTVLVVDMFAGAVVAQSSGKNDWKQTANWSDQSTIRILVESLSKAGKGADELWANLSPEVQDAILKYSKVERVITKVDTNEKEISILGSGCKTFTVKRSGLNALGGELWAYFQKIEWCYNGEKITSKTRLRWGEVYYPGWQFVGHIGNLEQGGVGQWSYRAWTQGEFKLCLGGDIGCIQYRYPWIDMTVYGNGANAYSSGG